MPSARHYGHSQRLGAILALLVLPAVVRAEEALTYEKHVRPILKLHCFRCHGEEEKPKAKLDLRLVRWMQRGGASGPALVASKPGASLLWQRIAAREMPPGKKKLSPQEQAVVQGWIAQGARTVRPEPERLTSEQWTEVERNFWSFQPIRRPAVPAVCAATLVRNPIDAFVLEKLETRKLGFSPEADRPTLIRRLSFDLLGLPPAPEEVDAFVEDTRPMPTSGWWIGCWPRRTTANAGPGTGSMSPVTPTATATLPRTPSGKYVWKYRDYLIRALNADRPWDELIREQLAGDEMVRPPYANLNAGDQDRLIATGFLRMAPDGTAIPTSIRTRRATT